MKKVVVQISLAAFLIAAFASPAMADTISFENPPCAPISPGVYPATCYFSSGLVLSSGGGNNGSGTQAFTIATDAATGSAVARPVAGFPVLNGGFLITPPYQGFGTDAVSLNVTGSTPGQTPWQLVFFGMESEQERFSGITDQRITLSPAAIALHGLSFGFFFTIGNPFQGIDNVMMGTGTTVVDPSTTPEPATLLLVATGGLAFLRRRILRRS